MSHKKFQIVLICLITFLMPLSVYSKDKLAAYPAPEGVALNGDFTVRVRQAGQEWKQLPSYIVNVDEVRGIDHHTENASMSYFDFEGEVEVSVTSNKGSIQTAKVRPLSYGIVPQINGNTLSFKLNKPRNLSVEVNNDIFHNLHLFANPIDEYVPNLKDKNLIYFGPGIHHFEGDKYSVESGKTVYVAGGAVLMGQIAMDGVQNVKILGRGVIDYTVKGGIHIARSQNILVEGLIATKCSTGESNNVTIRNVKSISYFQWGDGMNVFASTNVLFDGVFCRNSDDCTTVYGTRLGYKGGCKNITMQNSTLWADVAHPILIGIHGDVEHPEVLENLNYINIDILDHREKQIDYQGCLAITAGDNNLIRNVRFENIRIEDFRQGQLLHLHVGYNKKYCKAPGRGIEDVLFKDITYTGTNAELSIIAGYNEERKVKNVRFENLKINGQVISDSMPGKPGWYKTADMSRFYVGDHVENIQFVKTSTTFTPGEIWKDNNSVHINAHGGGILLRDDTYYWFGEHKTEGNGGNVAKVGVGCYSSKDLYNWKDEGIALTVAPEGSGSDIESGCILERPKVIYNEKTKKYVMYFHLELKGKGYSAARTGIAVSDNVSGPYQYLKSLRPNAGIWPVNLTKAQRTSVVTPNDIKNLTNSEKDDAITEGLYVRRDFKVGQMSRDMTLYVDDDQKAYHIFASEENKTLQIAELTDDYLGYTGKYYRIDPAGWNEAPALFKKDGKYFMITSGCTGWNPNPARVLTADKITGPWTRHPDNPAVGKDAETTFHSQSTYILPAQGKKDAFIFMADRWTPKNAIDGRYIWLPIRFENGLPVLKWMDEWDLSFFK